MASLSFTQLGDIQRLIQAMHELEVETIGVEVVVVNNPADERLGTVFYNHTAEAFEWEGS